MKTQLFTEIWKDIPGYIGLYQASTFGRIRNKKRNNHRSKKVRQCDLNTGELIKIYPSLHEMARITGFNRGHIVECINGKTKSSYGFKWEWL